ncbi:MAG: glycosyltransferase family 39 protein [Elusimicrobiota bacterium]
MKKYLILIILFYAFCLRFPIIFQPFCGYHAWNEGHYAMTATNFDKYGFFRQMNDLGEDYTATPLFSWIVYLSFKIFGITEWAGRLPNLIFSILSIYIFFLIIKKLYDDRTAYLSTLFASAAHGIVYFSRNLQLESQFLFFLLLSIYFAISYNKKLKTGYYFLTFLFAGFSVFTKFPAILGYFSVAVILLSNNLTKKILKFISASFISLIPAFIWIIYSSLKKVSQTVDYFTRISEWSWHYLLKALVKTPCITSEHLGIFISILVIIGGFFIIRDWKRHLFLIAFIIPWFLLLVPFPKAYLKNAYYDYPALYGFCVVAGIGAVELLKGGGGIKKKQFAIFLIVSTVAFGIVKTYNRLKKFDSFSKYAKIYEPTPFYSAKYVAKIRSDDETVLVDYPQTMFYAGGDPEFVKCIYGQTEKFISEQKYNYIILNYFGSYDFDEVKKELEKNRYNQVAPLAWKLKK